MRMRMHEIREVKEIQEVKEKVSYTVSIKEESAFLSEFEDISFVGSISLQTIAVKLSKAINEMITPDEVTDIILRQVIKNIREAITNGTPLTNEVYNAIDTIVHTYRYFKEPDVTLAELDKTIKEYAAHSELIKCAQLFVNLENDKTFRRAVAVMLNTALIARGMSDTKASKDHDRIVARYAFRAFMVFYSFFRIRDNFDELWEEDGIKRTVDAVLNYVYGVDQNELVPYTRENLFNAIHDAAIVARDLYHS